MKKFFSLFTALLFVGTMFAANYELMLTLDVTQGAPSGSTSTALNSSDLLSYLQGAAPTSANITAAEKISGDIYKGKGSGGSGIPQACLKIGKASGGGSFSFTIASTFDNVAKVELVGYGWKTDTKVAVNGSATQSPQTAASVVTFPYVLSTASKTITIAVTSSAFCATQIKLYKEVAPTEPTISANDINFGTVYVPNGTSYTHQYELAVTGTQLDNAITYESSDDAKVAVSGTLTATGGTLTLDVTAPHGDFAETITLTSGTVEKVVNVTGTVQSKYATPISVAEALTAFEAGTLVVNDSLQVRGLVKSASPLYNATSATIVITDVDDPTKEFTLYAIKSLNKANFASIENNVVRDINGNKFIVSDTLTAYGLVSTYSEPAKPQIASGGYLTAINRDKALINPEIIATPNSVSLTTHEAATDQSVALEYNDWEADATSATAKLYSDEECTSEITLGGWVSNFDFNADFSELTFDVSENAITAARTAYIKVVAENANENAAVVISVNQAAAPTLDTYKPTALANIQSTDVVIVTMEASSKLYALSAGIATSSRPAAVNVTDKKSDGNLSVYSNAAIFWNIVYDNTNEGYILYPNGETSRWLTGTSSGDPRINTGAGKYWTINKDYLYNPTAGKHIGVWTATPDWRTYAPQEGNVHGNISDETLCFYVKDDGEGTSLSNTAVENKAVKFIENGQLIINLNGVLYNALGERIR